MKTRRDFLTAASIAGMGVMSGPGRCWARSGGKAESGWNFSLVGDLHFDRLEHHDFDWVRREKPKDVRQIENYSRISEQNLPHLLNRVKKTVAAERCEMLVQIGDLVEGLCGTEKLARVHCEDAVALLEQQAFGVPVTITKGNHDVTGPGSVAAYDQVILPFLAKGLKSLPEEVDGPEHARFTQTHQETLFVYYDAYDRGSLAWFENLMKRRQPSRLFFVIHPPVVPYNARSAWCVYGREREQTLRDRLLKVLGEHHAIVLCGHLHKYSLVERATEQGGFTQLAVSSVAYSLKDTPKHLIDGLDSYGPDLVDLEPRHSPGTVAERRRILKREKKWIRRYDYGDFWGHAVVRVRKDRVSADIYQMLGGRPWKTVSLSE